jgi:hypothetical protein
MKIYKMVPGSMKAEAIEVGEGEGATSAAVVRALGVDYLSLEIVSASGYLGRWIPRESPWLMNLWVLDCGRYMPELKVNWRAWALYGRAPILGPAVITPDSDEGNFPGEWHPMAEELINVSVDDPDFEFSVMTPLRRTKDSWERLPDFADLRGRWE